MSTQDAATTVTVDVRYLVNASTGMARYTRDLIDDLLAAGASVELLTDHAPALEALGERFPGARASLCATSGLRWGAALVRHLGVHRSDVHIAPCNTGLPLRRVRGTRYVLVVHDLIPLRMPRTYLAPDPRSALVHVVKQVLNIHRAHHVFADSTASMADVRSFTGRSSRRLFPRLPDRALVLPPDADPPYFLYNGGDDPRKNVDVVLEACAELQRRTTTPFRLVMTGSDYAQWHGLIASLGLEQVVSIAGRVTDAEQAALVAATRCVVYPSSWEGFGLPVVEAFAAGRPVITGTGGSLREVGGAAAIRADVRSVSDVAARMQEVLEGPVDARAEEGLQQLEWLREQRARDWPQFMAVLAGETARPRLLVRAAVSVGEGWRFLRGRLRRRPPDAGRDDASPARPRVLFLVSGDERHGVNRYVGGLAGGVEAQGLAVSVHRLRADPSVADVVRAARAARAADVVHLQHAYAYWGGRFRQPVTVAALVIACAGRRRVVTLHDLHDPLAPAGRSPRALLRRVREEAGSFELTAVLLARSCHVTLTCTEAESERLTAVRTRRRAVVPMHVVSRTPGPEGHGPPAGGRMRLVVLGWIHPRKGQRRAVEALPLLPDCELLLAGAASAGNSQYLAEVHGRAAGLGVADRLDVTGYLSDEELDTALRGCRAAVAPYSSIAASASISTLLASGTPVVALENDHTSSLRSQCPLSVHVYDDDDPRQLAAAVRRCTAVPLELQRAEMSAWAQQFTPSAVARMVVDLYETSDDAVMTRPAG